MATLPQENTNVAMQQNNDVMAILKKQRSPNAEMSMAEILLTDLQRIGKEDELGGIYEMLKTMVEQGKARIMRANNSFLIYRIVGDKEVEFDIMTADSPKTLIKSIKEFFLAMEKAGFKRGMGMTEDTQLVKLLERSGIPIKTEQIQRFDGQKAIPSIGILVEL
jgi:Fe2+ or Zn2+ uptake regulation protein